MFFIVSFPLEIIIIEIGQRDKWEKCYNGNLCAFLKAFAWHYTNSDFCVGNKNQNKKQTIPITFCESRLTTFLHFIKSSNYGVETWAKKHKNFILQSRKNLQVCSL